MRPVYVAALLAGALVTIAVAARTTAGPTDEQKCLASKLKEVGKYDSCRLKAEAKAVIRGGAPDFSNCTSKILGKWTSIEGRFDCAHFGDRPAAQSDTDAHTDAIVTLLTDGIAPICGDGAVNALEECDGADLDGESCASLGYSGGVLACSIACGFDTSGCIAPANCGNGTIEIGEQCDGSDLNEVSCFFFGYSSGTLACDGLCDFDTSGCVDLCGNGSVDLAEECDGADLGGNSCVAEGGTGTLACSPDCQFDYSACVFTCGDGVANPGEECDGADLQFHQCASLGFADGTLGCTGTCEFDTSACTATCGDSIVSEGAGEECDGTEFNGIDDCAGLGYTSGAIACTGSCLIDTSACTLACDYLVQDCPLGEGCYLGIGGTGGCQPAGTAETWDACSAQADCLPRSFCLSIGSPPLGVCWPLCDATIGDADCPAGFTCLDTDIPADPDLGICVTF